MGQKIDPPLPSSSQLSLPSPPSPTSSSLRRASLEAQGDSSSAEMASNLPHRTSLYTEEEERIVTRKLDRRIVPIVFTLYVLAFLDRSNIGNAYTAGMGKELGISSNQYEWLLTIYYISYIIFQTMVLAWKVVPPKIIASFVTFAWGTVSILQATAFSWSSLMAARFFLGVFEATFAPGVALYLSYFYPKQQFGLRFGIYAAGAALASSFAGALAYALVHARGTGIATWRLLFIVEGAPTTLFAPAVYFLLPNSIEDCNFLSEREKEVAKLRMRSSTTNTEIKKTGTTKIEWADVVLALRDPTNYMTAALFFIANVTYASLPVYLPTILTQAGFSAVRAQGLSAPPYLAAFISAITFTFISDKLRHRGFFVASLSVVGGIGYLVLATRSDHWVRYGATFLVAIGCFTIVPLLYAWIANNQVRDSQRGAGFALFAVIGQCGPILGIHLYPSNEAPKYVKGMSIGASLLFFNVFLTLAMSFWFAHLNARLDNNQLGGARRWFVFSGKGPSESLVRHKNDTVTLDEAEAGARMVDSEGKDETQAAFRYVT
ncbi:MFS general substrate transporter [Clavulina sp. PMI_390]|nr:MFS general substrate transporter [Clavulina sp. PMI_390]